MTWTESDLEKVRQKWLKAQSDPRARRRNDRMNLRLNLPLRTRWRLGWDTCVNRAGIWLVNRGWPAAAERLWRLTGHWS